MMPVLRHSYWLCFAVTLALDRLYEYLITLHKVMNQVSARKKCEKLILMVVFIWYSIIEIFYSRASANVSLLLIGEVLFQMTGRANLREGMALRTTRWSRHSALGVCGICAIFNRGQCRERGLNHGDEVPD